ncbi:hypothetical protein Rhe02_91110 [Rhizocola hellebori]|uniref:Wax synthase domain-containing protein n=1 Tax=Rhizocola hellebori TaxID=1392758 RepID=A0A8J3QJT3_9ACTN|nr:MBOAT family protein [Rhizocola hellebori]GIH11044.1 hypothetical protein Rhe02_91110 [Rhizocola hellebori]
MLIGSLVCCAAIYAFAKLVGLWRGPLPTGLGLLAYSTIWPGVATRPFAQRRPANRTAAFSLMAQGTAVMAGAVTCWIMLWHSDIGPFARGWLGIAVILCTFHLGLSDVVTGGLRLNGFAVRRLFDAPLRSRSLREFWSLRWNHAFVQMNQVVFMPALRRRFGRHAAVAAFLLSGLLHELAISFPVGAGYGTPTLYFALHAAATNAEGRLKVLRWHPWARRLWTWAWLLLPLPLLFHRAFRDALVLPLVGGTR